MRRVAVTRTDHRFLPDSCRVIVQPLLPEPLMVPDEDERKGYVPNVLCSCGGVVHGETLILPQPYPSPVSVTGTTKTSVCRNAR